jgi:precorrin-2/cobalt-factor-2 C20-methyltransferase
MRLIGVGMGPGDPELVTVKAVRVLDTADLVLVPVMAPDEQGRAEATVRAHVTHDRVRRVVFALNEKGGRTERRTALWEAAAKEVADAFAAGVQTVAFATIGDPNLYSTFTYLAGTVRELVPQVEVETVPGITAMQDLAARSGTVLAEGSEPLVLLPVTRNLYAFEEAVHGPGTVVAYKFGELAPQIADLLGDRPGVYGSRLGLPGEEIGPAADMDERKPYLSVLIVPSRRSGLGGKL